MRTNNIGNLMGIDANVLLLDPPLAFASWSPKGEGPRSPQGHYGTMSIEQIAALPIRQIAGPNCWVLVWIPYPHVRLVGPLMDAWGVKLSGAGLTWIKVNADGSFFKGTGYAFRANPETAWLGSIGVPKRHDRGVSSVIIAPRGRAAPNRLLSILASCAWPDPIRCLLNYSPAVSVHPHTGMPPVMSSIRTPHRRRPSPTSRLRSTTTSKTSGAVYPRPMPKFVNACAGVARDGVNHEDRRNV